MAFQRRIPPTNGRYVAARTLDFGDWKVAEGEPFPWREKGMDEREVQRRWWIGELEAAPAVPFLRPGEDVPVGEQRRITVVDGHGGGNSQVIAVTAGECISVEAPQQHLTRAERRALRKQG